MKAPVASIALLLAAGAGVARAGLCTADETEYFGCKAGKREIALCGSASPVEDSGYIEYRFSDGRGPVQVFPKPRRPPRGLFTKDFVVWGRSGFEATVQFRSGDLDHVLYANLNVGSAGSMDADRLGIYGYHAGVRLYRGDALTSDIECDRGDAPAVDPIRFDRELPAFLEATPRK